MPSIKRVLSMGDIADMRNDDNDSGGSSTQPRRHCKKPKKSTKNVDSLPSSVADVDASTQSTQPTQPIQCTTADTPSTVTQSDLYKRVDELLSTVRSQQETNTLSAKLNFVLSFLSIADDEGKETAGGMETADLPIEPSESQSLNGSNGNTSTFFNKHVVTKVEISAL